MKEAISSTSSTRPTARYTVRLWPQQGRERLVDGAALAPPRAAEIRAAATPATSQVARAAMGRLESRRSTRYQCPEQQPVQGRAQEQGPGSQGQRP